MGKITLFINLDEFQKEVLDILSALSGRNGGEVEIWRGEGGELEEEVRESHLEFLQQLLYDSDPILRAVQQMGLRIGGEEQKVEIYRIYFYYSPILTPEEVERLQLPEIDLEKYREYYQNSQLEKRRKVLNRLLWELSQKDQVVTRRPYRSVVGQRPSGELLYCYGEEIAQVGVDVATTIRRWKIEHFGFLYPISPLLPALEEIQERGMLSYYFTITPEKVPPQLRAKLHRVLDLKELLLPTRYFNPTPN